MDNNTRINQLMIYEKELRKYLSNEEENDANIKKGFELFRDVYSFLLEQDMIPKGKRIYSTNRNTKKLIKYEKSYEYFSENTIRLHENICTLLSIVSENLTEVCIEKSTTESTAFFIKELNLGHFRIFESKQITLESGVNLIVGNNGVGKTTILDAVSVILSQYLKEFDVSLPSYISDIVSFKKDYYGISAAFDYNDSNTLNQKRIIDQNASVLLSSFAKLKLSSNESKTILPIISYYRISKDPVKTEYSKNTDNRIRSYNGCLLGRVNLEEIRKWLVSVSDNIIKQFLKTINMFIEAIEDDTGSVEWNAKELEIQYNNCNSKLKMDSLSSGYEQMLHLIIDLVYRAMLLNPFMENPENAPGIVLIDEIDLHLHPKWQWRIIEALRKTFPKVQFVITTHSPFVLSSCKKYNLILLADDIIYPSSLYGKSVSTIAQVVLGGYDIPKKLYDQVNDFENAWNDELYEIAENIVENIGKEYGTSNELYSKLYNRIRFKFAD